MRAPALTLVCVSSAAVLSCMPADDAPAPETPSIPAAAPSGENAEAAVDPVPEPVAAPAKPNAPDTAGAYDDLVGTTWQVGVHTFVFHHGGHVIVKGGDFDALAPNGVPGRASIRDGILEIRIADRTNWGTWDGTTLAIGDEQGVRVATP